MSPLSVLLLSLPLWFILWLANMAERAKVRAREASPVDVDAGRASQPTQSEGVNALAFVTYLLIVGFLLVLIFLGLTIQLTALIAPQVVQGPDAPLPGLDASNLVRMGLGFWLPSFFGLMLLLPPVRCLLSRLLPIDPHNVIHAVSLSLSMLIVVNLMTTMGIGLGNLALMLEESEETASTMGVLWVQEIGWAILAMIGVGLFSRRSLVDVLRRLGIVRLSWREGLASLGTGVGLAIAILLALVGLRQLGVTADEDVTRLSESLLGPLAGSLAGILTLGVAAALGEEPIFRGALLPRFGLLLSSVLFALIHSTYGITLSTAVVLVVGLVLGLTRRKWHTTGAMIVHAAYNMTLGLATFLSLLQLH